MVDQLRSAGELIQVSEGIDYPRGVADKLLARLDEMARHAPLTVSRVRDQLRTSRRHAEALIAFRRRLRARQH